MRATYVGLALIIVGMLLPLIYIMATALGSGNVSYGGAIIVFPIPVALVFGNGGAAMDLAMMLSIVLLVAFIAYVVLIVAAARRGGRAGEEGEGEGERGN